MVLNASIAHQAATQYAPSELCYIDIEQKIRQKKNACWVVSLGFIPNLLFPYLCFQLRQVFKYLLSSQVEIVMNSDPVLQVVTDNDLRGEQVYIYIYIHFLLQLRIINHMQVFGQPAQKLYAHICIKFTM